jgi:hypothetical protein
MQVSDMDVFTIVMAKTLEHGIKGKRSTGDGQRTLTELFEQMASLVGEVSKQVERLVAHETVQRDAQLVLVLREAQKRWQGA